MTRLYSIAWEPVRLVVDREQAIADYARMVRAAPTDHVWLVCTPDGPDSVTVCITGNGENGESLARRIAMLHNTALAAEQVADTESAMARAEMKGMVSGYTPDELARAGIV